MWAPLPFADEAYSVEPDVLRRQAILCIRLLKLGTDLAAEPLRVHIVQAAKHSMQGACAALQQLCGLASSALSVQWLVFERLAETLRSSWVGCCYSLYRPVLGHS